MNQDQKPDEMLHRALEEKEKQRENEWLETSRPVLFGSKKLKWDGVWKWVMGLGDNLLWKWFEDDVRASQNWERQRKEQKEQKERSAYVPPKRTTPIRTQPSSDNPTVNPDNEKPR